MDQKIGKLLDTGEVDGFLAYRGMNGVPVPTLFTRENRDALEAWQPIPARYPVLKMLLALVRANPEMRYGILVRGCEERALRELIKWNQVDGAKVMVLGQACSQELARACVCRKPYPDALDYGEPPAPVTENHGMRELEEMAREDRLAWWLSHFNRCIHCYGCRDVCPVCFCTECSLEHELLMCTKRLPPNTTFHLIRALHMAGRCIDCGLCEEVCPARIPLRSLYKEVNAIVEDGFGYIPGSEGEVSPFSFLGEESGLPSASRCVPMKSGPDVLSPVSCLRERS